MCAGNIISVIILDRWKGITQIEVVNMRTIILSDNDEVLLKEAIRNQIDLLDDLPVLMQDEIESRENYVDLVYRTSGYVV
jgi:hypothetical protein